MKTRILTFALFLAAVAAVGLYVIPAERVYSTSRTLEDRISVLENELEALRSAPAPEPAPIANDAPATFSAVANLEKLVNDSPRMVRMRDELKKYRDEEMKKIDDLKTRLETSIQKQKLTHQGSEEYWKWEKIIRPLKLEHKGMSGLLATELATRQMKNIEIVYEEIITAIAKYAEQKGYSYVFWLPGKIDKEVWDIARKQGNLFQHRYMIDVRPILYCSGKVDDITDDILKILKTAK